MRNDLQRLALARREDYAAAKPFPHVVIDGFLSIVDLELVTQELPTEPRDEKNCPTTMRKSMYKPDTLGPHIRILFETLNSPQFIEFLEVLTGIDGLKADMDFEGAGIHQTRRFGFLSIHSDFEWHERLQLYRRANAILFLNPIWPSFYRGELELWDSPMKKCVKSIKPLHNRLVVFSTAATSYHGQPDGVLCPENLARSSAVTYYYSKDPAPGAVKRTHTKYVNRPGESVAPSLWQRVKGRAMRWGR